MFALIIRAPLFGNCIGAPDCFLKLPYGLHRGFAVRSVFLNRMCRSVIFVVSSRALWVLLWVLMREIHTYLENRLLGLWFPVVTVEMDDFITSKHILLLGHIRWNV